VYDKDTGSDSEAETISPKFCWSSESEDDWGSDDDASSMGVPESICKFDACAPTATQSPPGSWQRSTVQQNTVQQQMPAWNFAAQQEEQWRFAYALNARKMAMGNQNFRSCQCCDASGYTGRESREASAPHASFQNGSQIRLLIACSMP
jgi:hypothetical protein